MTSENENLTPGQKRTAAATQASVRAARKRRVQRHVEALEKEGFTVTLEYVGKQE